MNKLSIYIRALRLPFISASIIPFIAGSIFATGSFSWPLFLLGLAAVIMTHLGANLLNDYADSRSGVDWQDVTFYGLFGGSKLIQEGLLPQSWYLRFCLVCFSLAFLFIIVASLIISNISILGFFLIILFLGWSYSYKPFKFSYNHLGELVLFILFGPALVMGGYFLQKEIFPAWNSLILSLPFGFFTLAVLFANEVPDFAGDHKLGKNTLINLIGIKKAYIGYSLIAILGFISILVNVIYGYVHIISLLTLILALPLFYAVKKIKHSYPDKLELLKSSKITILVNTAIGMIMLLGLII